MQKILVSSCLLGDPVGYDGNDLQVENEILRRWKEQGRIIYICPEVAAGLPVPRPPAEIVRGDGAMVLLGTASVIENTGEDVTDLFISGANRALSLCKKFSIKIAILSKLSPSCGDNTIYNGDFSGTTITGAGVTAALLQKHGISVFNQTAIGDAATYLEKISSSRLLDFVES